MRILHTSDLHLESSLSRLPSGKVRERKNELFMTFSRMVAEAERLGVRLFIIAGDLFDGERLTKKATERVADAIERAQDIDFLYLPGNHERLSFIERIGVIPKNLYVFGEDWTYFDYDGVVVAGRSECRADMFESLKLDAENKNIVVLHGGIKEYSGAEDGISLPDAQNKGIDYIALGHYHSYGVSRVDNRAVAVYSGTPEGRGFDEAGDCGFVLVETDDYAISHRFCPFAKRTVRIVEADISTAQRPAEVEDAVAEALDKIPATDLVRVLLVGERSPELSIDLGVLSARYEERFYLFEMRDETRMRIDPEAYKYDKSLKGEFIRLVSAREDIAPALRERIIRCGLSAMIGEDPEV